jgi:cellulose synthase (UDP-forming)
MFEAPADAFEVLWRDAGILIGLCTLCGILRPERFLDRLLFGSLSAIFVITYSAWRWHDTLPRLEPTAASLWPYLFFVFEAIAIAYTLLSILILFRRSDRTTEADIAQARLNANDNWPAVDIFICTYNEPLDVVEKSIIPALAIDYGPKTVWVLDDTRRTWLRDYCEEVGARYLTRPDNKGAKAGNLNNALRATAEITAAPLILVLDADFAVQPNILKRMVGLFGDPRVGVVQSPQFFYNADPIQHNLHASTSWVDDQRIFFDIFQPAKDAWGCAFCVGTSFLVRRDRLEEIGGFPHAAICEDLNLSYTLMSRGYKTHWLNERLSVGLSAEGLPEYLSQRTRWCLGTIQVALLKSGPLRGAGYSFMQRLQFVHTVLNWLCKPFIVLMLIAPAIYWFFDLPAFQADYLSFLRYGVPTLIALWAYNGWISRSRTLPLFMEVTHAVTALAVTVTLMTAVIRPFGRPFKVTDKGGDRSSLIVRWRMAAMFGGMSLLSAVSILWAYLGPYSTTEISPLDYFNVLWAGVSLLMTFIAFLVCFELPRDEVSFAMMVPGWAVQDKRLTKGQIVSLSMSRATLRAAGPGMVLDNGRPWTIMIPSVGLVTATTRRISGRDIELELKMTPDKRRKLILFLFSQPRYNIAASASMSGTLRGLWKRAFAG